MSGPAGGCAEPALSDYKPSINMHWSSVKSLRHKESPGKTCSAFDEERRLHAVRGRQENSNQQHPALES